MKFNHLLLLMGGLVLWPGCQKKSWVTGQWLMVTKEGMPGVCHQFKKDKSFLVFKGPECAGKAEPLLSGKWQLKEEAKLAVQRGTEEFAQLALITEKSAERFVASGALSGLFYRIETQGVLPLMARLEREGVIRFRVLPPALGCQQLSLPLPKIKALPSESSPRMIRQRDQGLEYHFSKQTGDPQIEKIVFALNQEVIEWIAFHLSPAAFQPPGPQGRLEGVLGKPVDAVVSGAGENRQHILMWRTYCKTLRGAINKEVDLTLFATNAKGRGTFYLSENVIASMWEEIKQVAQRASTQEPDQAEPDPPSAASESPDKDPPTAAAQPDTSRAAPPPPAARAPTRPPAESAPRPATPAPSGGEDDEI